MAEKEVQLNERDQKVDKASGGAITEAKIAWNNANTAYKEAKTQAEKDVAKQAMAEANKAANDVRSEYGGYSAGTNGIDYKPNAVTNGGRTAAQMEADMAAYKAANTNHGSDKYSRDVGWTNGYSTDMNLRSMANEIRQQMDANSAAWHDADENTRAYLHKQNELLAGLLPVGSSYDSKTGKWSTWNTNLGYGGYAGWNQDNVQNNQKMFYGYTDADRKNWDGDTSHYYNFVDTMAPARNTTDESSGYTGIYAQFKNGPYASLMSGTEEGGNINLVKYTDVIGDRFGDEGTFVRLPQYDENGNIIKYAPALKGNNDASAYTKQFMPVAQNGVLIGRGTRVNAMDPTTGNNNTAGQRNYVQNYGGYRLGDWGEIGGSGRSANSFEGYLRQIYGSALEAQLKALESGYNANLSELDAGQKTVDSAYTEQKRQTSGENARQSAAWREVANAYGLNSGAVGQAKLAQNNQLQSDLNKLNAAQAAARTELQRQRILLGQQYQSAIEQAVAENNSQLAMSLYQEAVRAEEALQQQNQFYANLAFQYGKSMANFAKSTGAISLEEQFNIIEDAVKNGFISEAQAMVWAQQKGIV